MNELFNDDSEVWLIWFNGLKVWKGRDGFVLPKGANINEAGRYSFLDVQVQRRLEDRSFVIVLDPEVAIRIARNGD